MEAHAQLQRARHRPFSSLCTKVSHRRRRHAQLCVFCLAQPHHGRQVKLTEQESHTSSGSTTSSSNRNDALSVAVHTRHTATEIVTTSSYSDLDASGQLAEQLAGQLVVVNASSTSAAVATTHATTAANSDIAAQQGSSPLPEGLPSPRSLDASLRSSLTSFSR